MINGKKSSSILAGERRPAGRRSGNEHHRRTNRCKETGEQPHSADWPGGCRSDMQLKELFYLWLDQSRLRVKQSTYAVYDRMIASHLIPYFGNLSLTEWNGAVIDRFVWHSLESGRTDGKGGLSPKSVSDLVYIIKSVIRFAKLKGLLMEMNERISLPRRNTKEIRVLSTEEQRILERCLSERMDQKRLGILVCLYTGIRLGEVCALRWEDVDLKTNTIHIRRTLQRIKNTDKEGTAHQKTRMLLDTPKSKSSIREIPIVEGLAKLLKKYAANKDRASYLLTGKKKYGEPRAYQRSFHRYISQAGLCDVNFHALRHTFATRCIEKGVDAKSLSEILGHANVNITLDRYVHSSFEWKRSQMARLAI